MKHAAGGAVASTLKVVSILILALAILTGPLSSIGIIADLAKLDHWNSVLLVPISSWNAHLRDLSKIAPFVASVPTWVLNSMYLVLLCATVLWYYWASVSVEYRRQVELARKLGSVEPFGGNTESHEMIPVAAGAGAALWALAAMLNPAIAVLLGLGGVLVGVAAREVVESREKAERAAHAQAETERITAEARESIADFKRKETTKLLVAALVAALIVGYNLLGPLAYQYLSRQSS